jgi:hypothetical protein
VVPWRPLLVVLPVLSAALATAHLAVAPPAMPSLLGVAMALLVAAVLLGLDDPARDLLAALPSSPARRRLHRLALLAPSLLVAGGSLLAVGHHLDLVTVTVASGTASLAALAAWGLVAGSVAERRRPELVAPVAAGAPIAWVVTAAALPVDGAIGVLARGWAEQHWGWTAAGALIWLLAGRVDPR